MAANPGGWHTLSRRPWWLPNGIQSKPKKGNKEMSQNLVFNHLTDEQWTQLDTAIGAVAGTLDPAMVPFTPGQKRSAVKMGDGSEAFCRLALQIAEENPSLIPSSIDLGEMRRDLASHDALNQRIVRLTRLLEKARDTEIALGSDAMVAALEIYAVLKVVGKADGVQALRRLLSRRFENNGPQATEAPVPAPVAA